MGFLPFPLDAGGGSLTLYTIAQNHRSHRWAGSRVGRLPKPPLVDGAAGGQCLLLSDQQSLHGNGYPYVSTAAVQPGAFP